MATEPIHPTKVCNKCGVEKPHTSEHFQNTRGSCKPCWRARENAYRAANPEKQREKAKRRWAKTDKEKARADIRAWKAANPDKARAIEQRRLARISADPAARAKAAKKMRLWRAANKERVAERARELRAADPDRHRAYDRKSYRKHRAKRLAADQRYRRENYEKVVAQVERRRARMLEAEGEFTGHDVIALIKTTGRVCFYCATKVRKIEVDHFIPLSRGGTNWPSNLVLACKPCNASKGAKMPWEWMPDRFTEGRKPR